MTLRTILVCLTDVSSAADLLKSAAVLARRDNAHLIGLFISESLVVYPGIAMHIPDITYQQFADSQKDHLKEIKAVFDSQMNAESFPSEWRQMHSETKPISECIIESAQSADLVVMAQEDDMQERMTALHLQAHVIRDSGRPVLVIPKGYTADTLGASVVIGWSATREATRATHDMLTVVNEDAKIRIVRVGKSMGRPLADFSANDLAAALARHGKSVDVVHREPLGDKVPEILGHAAFEVGADMLVTGAFGHSRTYDFVIGAATNALLRDAELPVLFSK